MKKRSRRLDIKDLHQNNFYPNILCCFCKPHKNYIENVTVRNTNAAAIALLAVDNVEIISCKILPPNNLGIQLLGYNAAFGGKIINTLVDGSGNSGMYISGLAGGEIRGNEVSNFGSLSASYGITLTAADIAWNANGNIVAGNTTRNGGSDDYGIYINANSSNNLIIENTAMINGTAGIFVNGSGSLVSRNVAAENTGDGIRVLGIGNLIENNQLQGNTSFGIYFLNANSHAYRNNMLRGNTAGTVSGSSNTDAGGNII